MARESDLSHVPPACFAPDVRLSGTLLRSGLLDHISEGDEDTISIVGPPGSGKTIAAAQLARRFADSGPVTWLNGSGVITTSGGDATPLTLALAEVMSRAETGRRRSRGRFDRLIIVDQADGIPASSLAEALDVSRGPARVVLVSRMPLAIRSARLSLHGRLLRVGLERLAFTGRELELLTSATPQLEHAARTAAEIAELTRGWPAFALSELQKRATPRTERQREKTTAHFAQHLLPGAAAELIDFALDVSVLPSLDPHLCERTTGRPDSNALVAQLLDRQIAFTQTGAASYVPIVRERLRQQRAYWRPRHTRHVQQAEAFSVLGRTGDWISAARLAVEDHSWHLAATALPQCLASLRATPSTVAELVRAVPIESLLRNSDLFAVAAVVALRESSREDSLRLIEGGQGPTAVPSVSAMADTLAHWTEGAVAPLVASLAASRTATPVWAVIADYMALAASWITGAASSPAVLLDGHRFLDQRQRRRFLRWAFLPSASTRAAWTMAHTRGLEDLVENALEILEATRPSVHPILDLAVLSELSTRVAPQDDALADRLADQTVRLVESLPSNEPARAVALAALRTVGRDHFWPRSGTAALTRRERELSGLLHSQLTFPEIAREMGISRNTVKGHAASIYAKLGVNGRTAAVAVLSAERRAGW